MLFFNLKNKILNYHMKNQLFKISPDLKITTDILLLFGLNGLDDNHSFTKQNLIDMNTVEKMNQNIEMIKKYYIPCKAKYLDNLTEKKCITVLRQFLKIHNYTLMYKEKYVKGEKFLFYQKLLFLMWFYDSLF